MLPANVQPSKSGISIGFFCCPPTSGTRSPDKRIRLLLYLAISMNISQNSYAVKVGTREN